MGIPYIGFSSYKSYQPSSLDPLSLFHSLDLTPIALFTPSITSSIFYWVTYISSVSVKGIIRYGVD